VVMGLAVIARNGGRHTGVRLRGDSKSSLKWAATQRFRAGPSRRAAMAFVAFGTRFGLAIEETQFIKGETNTQCDKLSRHKRPTDPELGFAEDMVIEAQQIPSLWNLLLALDPTSPITSDDQFEAVWGQIDRVTKAVGV